MDEDAMTTGFAKLPWSVDPTEHKWWSNSIGIVDADGGMVCILTRGYEDGPSFKNAQLICDAVNAFLKDEK